MSGDAVRKPSDVIGFGGRAFGQSREGLRMAEKSRLRTNVLPVPQTNTGRRGEYPQALERIPAKELGKMTP